MMERTGVVVIFVALLGVLVVSCSAKRPVLYPNKHFNDVGEVAAQSDIDDCIEFAASHGAGANRQAKVAGQTATGAAIGAATGAAVGAVTGNTGRGVAAGAAGGGAGGLMRGVLNSSDPDTIQRQFVEQCLRDQGYQPVGWR